MQQQMTIEDLYPATWCGRMYPEPSAVITEKTSEPSLKRPPKSQTKLPLFLDLRGASGAVAEPSWEMGGLLLGEYTMHSFGESPNEENASRLSQILEEHPLPKYYLSDRACAGILNRASKRGKELPKELKEALEAQATPSKLGGSEVDSHGKRAGKGALVQTEKAGTVAAVQDQTLIQAYGISPYASNAMMSDNPHSGIYKADTTRTLDNNGGNPACNQGGVMVVQCKTKEF